LSAALSSFNNVKWPSGGGSFTYECSDNPSETIKALEQLCERVDDDDDNDGENREK
jgi:hypothetical protein